MLKFLVTGAAGQLGKDVVRELENRGYEVTAVRQNMHIEERNPEMEF